MSGNYDVVVMGGGQNTLGCAAYLAKAGKKVLVLERNSVVGGGAVTVERNAPGFLFDKHSIAHAMIQANPLILNDELGLLSKFGLRYFYPEEASLTVLEDYRTLAFHRDLDKTCADIARHSQKDADTYREFVTWGMRILPLVVAGMFNVPLPMPAFLGMMESSEDGRRILELMLRSPLQIVNELFESDIVKIHLLKMTAEGFPHFPDEQGTGLGILLTPPFIHKYGVGMPLAGSGMLSNALVACIEHHGGEVKVNQEVSKVITQGGRAVGLETTTGEQYFGKDAVVAAIHPRNLDRFVDGLDPTLVARSKRTQQSPVSILKIDAALDRPLQRRDANGPVAGEAMGEFVMANTLTEYLESWDPLRHGRTAVDRPLFFGGAMAMPGRVPEGKALLYFLSFQPYNLENGGPTKWDAIKEKVADDLLEKLEHFIPDVRANVIGRSVDSPLDHERWSPNSFLEGDCGGLSSYFFHLSGYRPLPELAQYSVPGVEKLYLCGPFMHPGGGIFGIGRPTAIKILDDMGISIDKVVG